MQLRQFGSTDLRVSPVGVGCARIGGIFQRDPGGFVGLLSSALDAGINFFDTADIYSQGESETLIGRAFRGKRDQVVIASKAGYVLPAQRRFIARIKPLVRPLIRLLKISRKSLPSGVRGTPSQDFSPDHLRAAVEGSLRRLRTDRLDLFQLHSPSKEVIERGEWLPALEGLKRDGKIRHWGISCDTVDAALAALRVPGVASVQLVVNLLERRVAVAAVPRAKEQGVAVIARECLANGLLAKDPASIDLKAYCSSPEDEALRSSQLAAVREVARASGCELPRLALQYATQLEGVSVALIGVRAAGQLADNLRWLGAPTLPTGSLVASLRT